MLLVTFLTSRKHKIKNFAHVFQCFGERRVSYKDYLEPFSVSLILQRYFFTMTVFISWAEVVRLLPFAGFCHRDSAEFGLLLMSLRSVES